MYMCNFTFFGVQGSVFKPSLKFSWESFFHLLSFSLCSFISFLVSSGLIIALLSLSPRPNLRSL